MKPIRFAQLSDTHISRNSMDAPMMGEVFSKLPDTGESLAAALKLIDAQKLDFVLFCGDLVHEGDSEDYRYFKQIMDDNLKNTPAVVCLGNHDRKAAFREGYLEESGDEPYYHTVTINGLRIIALDSACGGEVFGAFDSAEYAWLEEQLSTPAERGTILMFHHPIVWNIKELTMQVDEQFRKLLSKSDVKAMFCGHTHENDISVFEDIPQVTGDSTAFGCRFTGGKMGFTDKASYNLCTISDTGLSVRNNLLNPMEKIAFNIDILELMRAVKQD